MRCARGRPQQAEDIVDCEPNIKGVVRQLQAGHDRPNDPEAAQIRGSTMLEAFAQLKLTPGASWQMKVPIKSPKLA
jgi:hypothetical protein